MFTARVLHTLGGKNYTCNTSVPLVFVNYTKVSHAPVRKSTCGLETSSFLTWCPPIPANGSSRQCAKRPNQPKIELESTKPSILLKAPPSIYRCSLNSTKCRSTLPPMPRRNTSAKSILPIPMSILIRMCLRSALMLVPSMLLNLETVGFRIISQAPLLGLQRQQSSRLSILRGLLRFTRLSSFRIWSNTLRITMRNGKESNSIGKTCEPQFSSSDSLTSSTLFHQSCRNTLRNT